jgi:glycosyltransferase involved in cell wall biosynthesis
MKNNSFTRRKDFRSRPSQDKLPRHIFHVITTIERGGAENQLLILAKAQIANGLDVTVIPLKGSNGLEKEFISSGVKIFDLRIYGSVISQIIALRKALPTESHILHAHLPQAELTSRFAKNRGSTFLITRHFGGNFYPGKNPVVSRFLSRLASSKAIAVIAISNAVETQLITHSEVKNVSKIEKIHYGFDCSEFKRNFVEVENSRKTFALSEAVIGTIARLSPEKDYPTLFRAFQSLTESFPQMTLRIAGVGPLQEELHVLAKKLGIHEKITWHGKVTNIPEFLEGIDVLVHTSMFEGFGMVLIEAMCMHKRIIAAGNSAQLEVLGNKGAGTFFETGNHSSLVSKILESWNSHPQDYIVPQDFQLHLFSVENLISRTNNLYSRASEEHF